MRRIALTLPSVLIVLALGACGDGPVAPEVADTSMDARLQHGRPQRGTGLALDNVVGGLPIIGDVQVEQIVITEFSTFLGGLQASGTITGTSITVPGLTLTEDFTADVLVSSTGSGRCDLVTLDLAPIGADVFGIVGVDIPVANISGEGTGPVGSLLCALGSIVNPVVGGVVGGLVNALNALLR